MDGNTYTDFISNLFLSRIVCTDARKRYNKCPNKQIDWLELKNCSFEKPLLHYYCRSDGAVQLLLTEHSEYL